MKLYVNVYGCVCHTYC